MLVMSSHRPLISCLCEMASSRSLPSSLDLLSLSPCWASPCSSGPSSAYLLSMSCAAFCVLSYSFASFAAVCLCSFVDGAAPGSCGQSPFLILVKTSLGVIPWLSPLSQLLLQYVCSCNASQALLPCAREFFYFAGEALLMGEASPFWACFWPITILIATVLPTMMSFSATPVGRGVILRFYKFECGDSFLPFDDPSLPCQFLPCHMFLH